MLCREDEKRSACGASSDEFIREPDRTFAQASIFCNARSWERLTYVVYRSLEERGYAPSPLNPILYNKLDTTAQTWRLQSALRMGNMDCSESGAEPRCGTNHSQKA